MEGGKFQGLVWTTLALSTDQ